MADASLPRSAERPQAAFDRLTPDTRRTIWGAFIGFFVDMYDVYLPVVALTPALIYFQPKNLPAATKATLFYVVFAVTLLGRPIGSFIFGHLGDRIGRRKTTLIAVSGFGVVTLIIALLPGYSTIGIASLVLLIVLRLVDGIFLGGEYTAASPLAMEYCPKRLRGIYSAIIQAGYPVAYVVISLFTALMLVVTPDKGGLNSPYVQYGWRIPFIVGAAIALAFVLWYRRVPESKSWEQSEKQDNPVGSLFADPTSRSTFIQVFILMSGFWLSLNAVISTLPQVLLKEHFTSRQETTILLIANVVLIGGYLLAGALGQRIGRKTILVALGLLTAVVSAGCYYLLIRLAPARDLVTVTVLATVTTTITVCGWGILSAYINERFQTSIRASGFGIGYSLAVVLPAFYSFAMLGMGSFMPYKYTQIPLVVLGGLLILAGAVMGPETKDVDLSEPAEEAGPVRETWQPRGRPIVS